MVPEEEEALQLTRVPVELLVSIAEILSGDLCFKTLANLNVASRVVHKETLSVLYETLTMQYSQLLVKVEMDALGPERACPMRLNYVKFLILENACPGADLLQDAPMLRSTFPSLCLCLVKEARILTWPDGKRGRHCELFLYRRIEFDALVHIIASSSSPRRFESRDVEPISADFVAERVNHLTLEEEGIIVCKSSYPASSELEEQPNSTFSDRVSFRLAPRNAKRNQDDFAKDLLGMLKMILPNSMCPNTLRVVHFYCSHTVLSTVMALSGSLPPQIGLSVRVTDSSMPALSVRKLLEDGAERYLASRNRYLDEEKRDILDPSRQRYLQHLGRWGSTAWQMLIQVKIDSTADQAFATLLDDGGSHNVDIYVHDAQTNTIEPHEKAEMVLGVPRALLPPHLAEATTNGRYLELFSS